jgi:hypothetical protein
MRMPAKAVYLSTPHTPRALQAGTASPFIR